MMKRTILFFLVAAAAAAADSITVANGLVTAKTGIATCTFKLNSSGVKVHASCTAAGVSAPLAQDVTPALTATASAGGGNFVIGGAQIGWLISRLSATKVRYQIAAGALQKTGTF